MGLPCVRTKALGHRAIDATGLPLVNLMLGCVLGAISMIQLRTYSGLLHLAFIRVGRSWPFLLRWGCEAWALAARMVLSCVTIQVIHPCLGDSWAYGIRCACIAQQCAAVHDRSG